MPNGKKRKGVDAGKGEPKKSAKTTVKTVPPPEITPNKPELVVVLDKTGAVPAKYPILEFDIKGPPGWLYEVQVSRKDADKLTSGRGLAGAWDKSKAPKDRLPQRLFSSWTNGEKTLKLDGAGKAKYKMPLDWWKDLARLSKNDFQTDQFYYRVLAFKDAASSIAYSTKDNGTPPSVKIHNNLVGIKLTNLGYSANGLSKPERVEFTVREPDTTEMYTMVQWMQGAFRFWGGADSFSTHTLYNILHYSNFPDWTIDSVLTNPRPSFFGGSAGPTISADKKTASGTDHPGSAALPPGYTHKFNLVDFESRIHLNFEVPAVVKIIRQEGSAPIFGVITGVLNDPQPFILDSGTWNVRILQVRETDGSVTVSHPAAFAGP